MTVTLDLPSNVEEAYRAAAQARGVPLAEVVKEVLVAGQPPELPMRSHVQLSPDEWLCEYKAWGQRHVHDDLPILPDEALSRDSIYEGRGR
jgi:hypothetical protein